MTSLEKAYQAVTEYRIECLKFFPPDCNCIEYKDILLRMKVEKDQLYM